MNKPFLKWAGNKYRVLSHILPLFSIPDIFIEPFVGSLSVTLNAHANSYVVNDFNEDLIFLYTFVLNDSSFIEDAEKYFMDKNEEELYYSCRKQFNETDDKRLKAILFVYLNRHCFNGLTRYNKSGEFNVPFGKYKSPYFPKKEMYEFRNILSNRSIKFYSGDFSNKNLYSQVTSKSVVYFDPPYLPLSSTANFSDYATGGFSYNDQIRLRDKAVELSKLGVTVIISNHDTLDARELYSSASSLIPINVSRTIAANKNSREKVKELLAVWSS